MKPILSVHNLKKEFGGLCAVRDVSFSIEYAHIKSLIGPNGAGKTTIFNLINSFYPVSCGEIYFLNNRIDNKKAYNLCAMGLARTFQNVRIFPEMSVLENIMIGCHSKSRAGIFSSAFRLASVKREERAIKERAFKELKFIGLENKANNKAGSLPFGNQRVLEIARALASEPKLILLDEPAAGLNTHEKIELAKLVIQIRNRGITVFMVEHDMGLVMDISDYIMVLNLGEKIAEGTPSQIQNNQIVIDAYLGEEL